MPFNLWAPELVIFLEVVLIVSGSGRLPQEMADLGRGAKEFKQTSAAGAPAGQTPGAPQRRRARAAPQAPGRPAP